MKKKKLRWFLILACLSIFTVASFAQVASTGVITGTAVDPKGAVVAGANVVIRNNATGQEFTVVTNSNGIFTVPSVVAGTYTATITATGFKQANVTEIKVDVGSSSNLGNIELQVGVATEQVTIVGGGELVKTDNATVGTTLVGRQITDIPTASRDALDLVLAMPGTTTPGRPRTSSVNGLPKGALNITLDGINVQDNVLKSSDGFFTYIRPRTDAISEVTVSTSNPGAESSGEGAVQIKFVTQSGANNYRGGVYWYHRNPSLNANYWFNNRDLPANPATGKAPQNRILLNQPGGKIGGPISIPGLFNGKDKAFFFINYEEFRLPETTLRTRTILSPQAQAGNFRFLAGASYVPVAGSGVTCVPAATGQTCSVNLLTVAGNAGFTNTFDPTISSLLTSIRSSVSGLSIQETGDPNLQTVSFTNRGGQTRKFPTVRLDFNVTKNHHVENIWNYQEFRSVVDFLNGVDPAFPGFPNFGSQDSNRFSHVTAWRWNLTSNLVNEARLGFTGGTVLFFPQVNPSQFTNQGGFNLGIGAAGISNATVAFNQTRRNSPVTQFTDTLTWIKGNHQLNFGLTFTDVGLWLQVQTQVPSIGFGATTLDPTILSFFQSPALGLPVANQVAANNLYNVLVGRITSIGGNARLNETTNQYTYLGPGTQRANMKEWGLFAQDTWRFRPNLTFTFGVRFEQQRPFTPGNDTLAQVSYAGLFGQSGEGNIFKPGTLTGSPSTYTSFRKGDRAYNLSDGTFAPSLGITFSPNFGGKMKFLFGNAGQLVLRGGYSRAFIREGSNTFLSIFNSNPGGLVDASRNLALGNLTAGTLLRNTPNNNATLAGAFPATPTYPNGGLITDSVNAFLPDLKIGHVDSYTFGVQRELNSNTVLEVRYVGNRGRDLWRQYNLNETNVIENGILNEFRLAQQNLIANFNAGFGFNFRYRGPGTGTNPLPISLAYFTGLAANTPGGDPTNPANYTSANFGSATWINNLHPLAPSVIGFAGAFNTTAFENRRTPIGQNVFGTTTPGLGLFPINQFWVNPTKRGGAFVIDNSAKSWYDALIIELRRRLASGLLVQASYTYGKALSNTYASSSIVLDPPATIRDFSKRKGVAPFDIRSAFKTNFIWELPVGRGKWIGRDVNRFVDHLVGGWGINGNIRLQSGTPFAFGNVSLVGITREQLQKLVGIYKDGVTSAGTPDGFVYAFPKDFRDQTFRAFNIGFSSTAGFINTQGTPSGQYMAPATNGNCLQTYPGECGFNNLVLKGPAFYRADLSIVKRVRFTERIGGEVRAEFLNAFNNINFIVGNPANDVNTLGGQATPAFARITSAYQDLSTTNDPGGRLVQLVVRLNF